MEKVISSKRIKNVVAVILLALMFVPLVFGVIALCEQYKQNGIGALIDLQNEKYQKEQSSPTNLTVEGV